MFIVYNTAQFVQSESRMSSSSYSQTL